MVIQVEDEMRARVASRNVQRRYTDFYLGHAGHEALKLHSNMFVKLAPLPMSDSLDDARSPLKMERATSDSVQEMFRTRKSSSLVYASGSSELPWEGNHGKHLSPLNSVQQKHREDMSRYGMRIISNMPGRSSLDEDGEDLTKDRTREFSDFSFDGPASADKLHASSCRAVLTSTNTRGSFLPSESSWAMPNPFARVTGSLSANSSPINRRSSKLRISSSGFDEEIHDDFKMSLSPTFWGLRQISEPLMRKVEDYELVDVQYVYNMIVDGMAGHILIDTRSSEAFKEEHVFGSILLEDCRNRWGRHAVLISETGEFMSREKHAFDALQQSEHMLSIKMVQGGYAEFQANYGFLCEAQAETSQEAQKQRRSRRLHSYPSQVLSWLFISGIEPAEDEQVLKDLNLTHIVSVTAKPHMVSVPADFHHLKIAIRDEKEEDISVHFERTWDFISSAHHKGGKVLVHCKMGRSRSACMVLMCLVRSGIFTLQGAWKHLKLCRRQIAINKGFTQQLIDFEKSFTGTNTVTWNEQTQQFSFNDL